MEKSAIKNSYIEARLLLPEDISDEITWNNHPYKVIRVDRWDEWGYCVAYAARR